MSFLSSIEPHAATAGNDGRNLFDLINRFCLTIAHQLVLEECSRDHMMDVFKVNEIKSLPKETWKREKTKKKRKERTHRKREVPETEKNEEEGYGQAGLINKRTGQDFHRELELFAGKARNLPLVYPLLRPMQQINRCKMMLQLPPYHILEKRFQTLVCMISM